MPYNFPAGQINYPKKYVCRGGTNDQECPGELGAFGYPGKDWEFN